jgi:hypothetical protein
MRTAALIVSYNTVEDLRECLQALRKSGAEEDSVYVADNASTDGSGAMVAQEFPAVRLIRNADNLNYAQATNQLIEAARADYLLLLNPDTRADFRALLSLLAHFESDSHLAAVAPQLRNPDDSIQSSCRRFPDAWTPWRELVGAVVGGASRWKMSDFDHKSCQYVDQPMFSCIWLSRRALEDAGTLSVEYPLFFNDVDWCWRSRSRGWRILFDPSVGVVHTRGGTTGKYRWRKLWHSHFAFARFLWRNQSNILAALLGATVAWLLVLPRALTTFLRRT